MTSRHPRLTPYAVEDVLVPTGPESAAFDRMAIDEVGVPQPVLMENAGRCAAAVLDRLFPAGPVVGLVGAGNNGGDALVLLRTLRSWGREATAVLVADRPAEEPLLHGWPMTVRTDAELGVAEWAALCDGAVVVDGVLGTGIQGAPRERQAAAIRRVNGSGCPVLAIDVPSGIDAETGAVPGDAVRADVTVAFGGPKLGGLLHPARALTGRLVSVEIGFPPLREEHASARAVTPLWVQARLPMRSSDTHKNAVGRVLVVAGRVGMAGAAVLAARAAFRTGAGLVRVCSAPENRSAIQSAIPEAIFVDGGDSVALGDALGQVDAVGVGPGLGTDEAATAMMRAVATGPTLPTVLDADALNLAAMGAWDMSAFARGRQVLITPHPGEMSRLVPDAPNDRVSVTREAAARFGCAVLLKGAPSLVASAGSPVLVDTQSSSDLAVAGMGDALTGVCAALLAQGLLPRDAGAVGVYLSGRAARIAGRGAGLTPSDVIRWLPDALQERGRGDDGLGLPFVTFDAEAAR